MTTIKRRLTSALPTRGWLVLGALWLLAVVAAAVTRHNWGPDSRVYLAWTYWFLGHPQAEAAQLAYDYLHDNPGLKHCVETCWPPGYAEDFFTGQFAVVVGPRLLLPVLSAPLVALFGPAGMLLIPVLSYGAAVVATTVLAARLWGQRWALLAGAALLLPTFISRYAFVAHTEGAAVLLTALPVLFLPLARRTGRRELWWWIALVFIGMLNRQFAIALPAGVAVVWAYVALRDRRPRNVWAPFAFWGLLVSGAALAASMLITPRIFGGDGLSLTALFNYHAESQFGVTGLAAVPRVLTHIVSDDYFGVRDDLFLITLLAASVIAVGWRFRSELAVLTAGSFFVVSAINVLEFWPTSFRYHVPVVPLLVLSVVALLVDLWGPHRRRPSHSTETTPRDLSADPDASVDPAQPGRPPRRLQPAHRAFAWLGALPVHAWIALTGVGAAVATVLHHRSWHFNPDSRHHLAWADRYAGASPVEATDFTWAELHEEKFSRETLCGDGGCWQTGYDWLFAPGASTDPNLLYPLLSAPFVQLFHDDGLQTVPLVSFVVATLLLTVFAARRWGALAGAALGLTFVLSDRIAVAAITGVPDMLGVAFIAGALFTLPLDRRRGRGALLGFGLLLLLTLTTRATAVAWVGALAVAWLVAARSGPAGSPGAGYGRDNRWTPYLAVSAALAAAVMALGEFVPALDARYLGDYRELLDDGLLDQLGDITPHNLTYLLGDIVLCCVLLTAAWVILRRLRQDSFAPLALGGAVVCGVLQLLDGDPNGARSFSVIYPVLLLTAVSGFRHLLAGFHPAGTPVEEERAAPTPARPSAEPTSAGAAPETTGTTAGATADPAHRTGGPRPAAAPTSPAPLPVSVSVDANTTPSGPVSPARPT